MTPIEEMCRALETYSAECGLGNVSDQDTLAHLPVWLLKMVLDASENLLSYAEAMASTRKSIQVHTEALQTRIDQLGKDIADLIKKG